MTIAAVRRGINLPVVGAVWALTVVSLVPIPSIVYTVISAIASLAANCLAVYLLFSRTAADRMHGAARLLLQLVVLAAGVVIVLRSGIGIEGLLRYVLKQAH